MGSFRSVLEHGAILRTVISRFEASADHLFRSGDRRKYPAEGRLFSPGDQFMNVM